MFTFLEPILQNDELMDTVITFVLADGDFETAAKRLFIHVNTLRYRIGKISEMLSPGKNFNAFFNDLSNAVKIYLASRTQTEIENVRP
ncbi:MAG: helix-turn-helix domain-containing protein [Anaerovoracaceae bacterium]